MNNYMLDIWQFPNYIAVKLFCYSVLLFEET